MITKHKRPVQYDHLDQNFVVNDHGFKVPDYLTWCHQYLSNEWNLFSRRLPNANLMLKSLKSHDLNRYLDYEMLKILRIYALFSTVCNQVDGKDKTLVKLLADPDLFYDLPKTLQVQLVKLQQEMPYCWYVAGYKLIKNWYLSFKLGEQHFNAVLQCAILFGYLKPTMWFSLASHQIRSRDLKVLLAYDDYRNVFSAYLSHWFYRQKITPIKALTLIFPTDIQTNLDHAVFTYDASDINFVCKLKLNLRD